MVSVHFWVYYFKVVILKEWESVIDIVYMNTLTL